MEVWKIVFHSILEIFHSIPFHSGIFHIPYQNFRSIPFHVPFHSIPCPACYANLRNLGRIASKLTKPLKVQLVHSLILSHIDYCNALFYNLPKYLLHKLTKVLYSAVRFIFGRRGSALRMHMLRGARRKFFRRGQAMYLLSTGSNKTLQLQPGFCKGLEPKVK